MDKSMKYFSHYFQEIQTTKDKFRDYINRNDSESEKLIEMSELSDLKQEDIKEAVVDEKTAAIKRIREMGRTLDDISIKMSDVKEETIRLTQENEVIDEYILNLMEQSKTFEPARLNWIFRRLSLSVLKLLWDLFKVLNLIYLDTFDFWFNL